MKRFVIASGILSLLIGLLSAIPLSTSAADKKESTSAKKSPSVKKATTEKNNKKAADDEKPKFKGRLPAYYGSVVDEKQRAAIYALQEEYHNKLEQLKKDHAKQIKELESEEDEAIADVLTDEQKEKVAELKAKRRGTSKTATKKSSTTKK